ncbi:MAG: FecR domain-containing protein, partial [Candidatus Eremiobacteraeota bacterium]|nr:FecR domain-containing protein [Candidatus Eremiobacteraeota bacterium]
MTIKSFISVISAVAIAGVVLTSAVRTPAEPAPDKNGPGVVRISVLEGSAVVQRGESHVQTSAERNAPMLPGDYISTGKTSRAELQFDGYTAVRLGGNAQARIVSNDPNNRKMQLAEGTIEIGMVRDGAPMQIDTPSATVRMRQAGDFRITIAADGSSWITARRGAADVITPQSTYSLDGGKMLIARGSAVQPSISDGPDVAFDSFDDFNVQRDKTMVAARNTSPYLNPGLAGYDDLNSYGQWQAVAGYGQSWVPNEPAGWVPYRNGSWVWEGGYGWTWIGSEPWGWVPYHYGNWYYCGCGASGWAWLPPSYAATPTWSPALVGFFGFDVASTGGYNNCGGNYGYAPSSSEAPAGPSENAPASYNQPAPEAPSSSGAPPPSGMGGPSPYGEGGPGPSGYPAPSYGAPAPYAAPYPYIGWVPVAPYEPFYPWWPGWSWLGFGWGLPFFGGYGYPAGFATNIVRVTNIYNINRTYRNFRHGGASGSSLRNFRHGTLHGHTVAVTPRDLGHHVGTLHGALPVAPTRDNLGFSHGTLHAPVTFSKAFSSPRFRSERALTGRSLFAQQAKVVAQAIRGGLTGHAISHPALARASAPVSHERANVTPSHAYVAERHTYAPETHAYAPAMHAYAPEAHAYASRARENPQVMRETAPVTRENMAPMTRANSEMREPSVAPRQMEGTREMEATRNEYAPSGSWDR